MSIIVVVMQMQVLCAADDFDSTIKDMFCEKIAKEKEAIERNKVILQRIEADLDKKAKNGMQEQEMCIREGLSALKIVEYSYGPILVKLDSMECKDFRIKLFNELERVREVNKLFSSVNLNIEDCLLKNAVSSKGNAGNEIIKDEVVGKRELIKTDASMPEDYPAARSPFR